MKFKLSSIFILLLFFVRPAVADFSDIENSFRKGKLATAQFSVEKFKLLFNRLPKTVEEAECSFSIDPNGHLVTCDMLIYPEFTRSLILREIANGTQYEIVSLGADNVAGGNGENADISIVGPAKLILSKLNGPIDQLELAKRLIESSDEHDVGQGLEGMISAGSTNDGAFESLLETLKSKDSFLLWADSIPLTKVLPAEKAERLLEAALGSSDSRNRYEAKQMLSELKNGPAPVVVDHPRPYEVPGNPYATFPPRIVRGVRSVPFHKGGQIVGLRVFQPMADAFLTTKGVCEGDVLLKVDSEPVSMERLHNYDDGVDPKSISVERNGQVIELLVQGGKPASCPPRQVFTKLKVNEVIQNIKSETNPEVLKAVICSTMMKSFESTPADAEKFSELFSLLFKAAANDAVDPACSLRGAENVYKYLPLPHSPTFQHYLENEVFSTLESILLNLKDHSPTDAPFDNNPHFTKRVFAGYLLGAISNANFKRAIWIFQQVLANETLLTYGVLVGLGSAKPLPPTLIVKIKHIAEATYFRDPRISNEARRLLAALR